MDLETYRQMPLGGQLDISHPDLQGKLTGLSAQKARLDELKGRWVAIITTGFELTKADQYLHMAELGMTVFIVEDAECKVAIELEKLSSSIRHVKCDMAPNAGLVDRVISSLSAATKAALENSVPNVSGMTVPGLLSACWTIWDDGVCLASRIQQALGLRGDLPDIIDTCHNKYSARMRLEENGFEGPRSILLRNMEDCKEAAAELEYPIVVKPVNGAASIGIHFMNSHEELLERYVTVRSELQSIYADEELMGLVFEDSNVSNQDELLYFCAEEFIGGQEFDVDVLMHEGEAVYANVGQDWKYKAGWMCERGMHHPASLTASDYQRIVEGASACAKALGCTTGIYHVEMKDDPRLGPQMIECNPRMGGGPVYDFHRLAWGVDLIAEAAMAFMGLPVNPPGGRTPEESHGCVVSLLLFSDQCGTLREDMINSNAEITNHPLTAFFSVPSKKGAEVRGWHGDKFPSHLGRADFFIPKEHPEYRRALEIGMTMRSKICVPLAGGDHYDSNDDSLN